MCGKGEIQINQIPFSASIKKKKLKKDDKFFFVAREFCYTFNKQPNSRFRPSIQKLRKDDKFFFFLLHINVLIVPGYYGCWNAINTVHRHMLLMCKLFKLGIFELDRFFFIYHFYVCVLCRCGVYGSYGAAHIQPIFYKFSICCIIRKQLFQRPP